MDIQIKKQKSISDQAHPTNGLDHLPPEIVLGIASRLPITSLIQFKFVCKSFYNLLHDTQLVKQHMSRAVKTDLCLIFHADYAVRNHLYFLEFTEHGGEGEVVRRINTPFENSLPEFKVVGSCQGLLCISDSLFSDPLYVYNPFTRDYQELPKSVQFEVKNFVYGFGFHPVTKEYKVIKIVNYACFKADVQVLTLGTNRWRSVGEVSDMFDRSSQGVMLNGKIYWLTRFGNYYGHVERLIVSFDLADEVFGEVPKTDFVIKRPWHEHHLAVLGDCLAVGVTSFKYGGGFEIWVMREYNMKESWVKQYTIRAYTPTPNSVTQHWQPLVVKVLCLLKNGELLLEYSGGDLVSYDPQNDVFRNLKFQPRPYLFQTTLHVGCLNWIDF